jgi:hypothetical protein
LKNLDNVKESRSMPFLRNEFSDQLCAWSKSTSSFCSGIPSSESISNS